MLPAVATDTISHSTTSRPSPASGGSTRSHRPRQSKGGLRTEAGATAVGASLAAALGTTLRSRAGVSGNAASTGEWKTAETMGVLLRP